jgi:DNA-binding winged helix-turn-helix (wHTH) protein
VTFVFNEFELDPARRELRVDGNPRQLQPQVFDLLLYLVENRERVVPKRELLDTLWPETIVTESSIQRAVSLARSALGHPVRQTRHRALGPSEGAAEPRAEDGRPEGRARCVRL